MVYQLTQFSPFVLALTLSSRKICSSTVYSLFSHFLALKHTRVHAYIFYTTKWYTYLSIGLISLMCIFLSSNYTQSFAYKERVSTHVRALLKDKEGKEEISKQRRRYRTYYHRFAHKEACASTVLDRLKTNRFKSIRS